MQEKNPKEFICKQLNVVIESRIEGAKQAIKSIEESQGNETKSSAGDKYETGRAMLQQEQDKNELQLSNALELKNILDKLNINKKYINVELGSLVITNQGNYFLSIGFGKMEIDKQSYYAISSGSALGKVLLGKKVGDKASYLQKEFTILEIV